MIESGFDPTARSPAGAVGLWQFMPETAKIYGLAHRPLARPAPERAAGDRSRGRLPRRPAPALRQLGARDRRLQHGLRGARVGRSGGTTRTTSGRSRAPRARCPGRRRSTCRRSSRPPSSRTTWRRSASATSRSTRRSRPTRSTSRPGTPLALVAQAAGCTLEGRRGAQPRASRVAHPARRRRRRERPAPVSVPARQGRRRRRRRSLRLRAGPAAARSLRRPLRRDARADRGVPQDDDAKLVELNAIAPGRGRPRRDGAARAAHRRAGRRRRRRPRGRPARGPRSSCRPTSSSTRTASASSTACSWATRSRRLPARSTSRPTISRAGTTSTPAARLQEGMTLQAFVAARRRPLARRRRAGERRARARRRLRRVLRGARARQGHEAHHGGRARRATRSRPSASAST